MKRVVLTIDKLFSKTINLLAAGAMLALLIVVFTQVVDRYFLGGAMPWSEELTRLLFVWMVLLAAACATHLRIDVLVNALGQKMRFLAEIAIAVFSIGLLAFMAWTGFFLVRILGSDQYPILGISVQYLYWSIVAGSILWIVGTVLALLRLSN